MSRRAIRHDLNLTEAAAALFTSQSGVSKQIRDLELELGIELFIRRGKRLTGLTEAGRGAIEIIERIALETGNLRRFAGRFAAQDAGTLVLAATPNQASYTVPYIVHAFARKFPGVAIEMREGLIDQVIQSVLDGDADIAVTADMLDDFHDLASFPCFEWRLLPIVPRDHPLAASPGITLSDLADHPIITYGANVSPMRRVASAFEALSLPLNVKLTAIEASAIKQYVRLGLGVGIVAEMAVDEHDSSLVVPRQAAPLFEPLVTKVATRRGTLLRSYAYRFMELMAPHLTEQKVRTAIDRGKPIDEELASWSDLHGPSQAELARALV